MLSLMVDKETLALHVNAVIVQIGLVVFDANFNPVSELKLNIDVTTSLLDGFEADPKTCRDFWAKQSMATKQSVLFEGPRIPPRDAANVLDKWLKDTFKGENFNVWANGILFDIPKFDHFFQRYGLKPLTDRTRYNLVYDYRTIRAAVESLYPKELKHAKDIMTNSMAHDALADCYYQLGMLNACMAILARTYSIVDDSGAPTSVAGIHDSVLLDSLTAIEALDDEQPERPFFPKHLDPSSEYNGSQPVDDEPPGDIVEEYLQMENFLKCEPPIDSFLTEEIILEPVEDPVKDWDDSDDDNSFAESVVYADVAMRQHVTIQVPDPAPFHNAV